MQTLRAQEAELKAQSAQFEAKFGPGYPKLRELQNRSGKLKASIGEELRSSNERMHDELLSAEKNESMVRKALEVQKQEAFRLNQGAAEFAMLRHEVESSQALSDALEMKLKQATVSAGLASTDISIIDRAKVPAWPILPNKSRNLTLGLIASLVGALMLGFMLEAVDDTLMTSDQIESWCALPVLASIPEFADRSSRSGAASESAYESGLVLLDRPRSNAAEAYRALRSALMLSNVDHAPCLIVISSAFPSEGKTVTSTNCAIALAQRGGRVLLVDGDLRRSTIHKRFGLGAKVGLSSLLAGTSESQECITAPVPDLPKLWVLPAGPPPPAPAEMLASQRMADMLKKWRGEFDHVVIDTPPIFAVTDALVLAAQADAVLLVARAGVTRKRALQRMNDMLSRINARVAGVVLNGADLHLEHYYSGPYRYRYGMGYYKYSYKGYHDAYYSNDQGNGDGSSVGKQDKS